MLKIDDSEVRQMLKDIQLDVVKAWRDSGKLFKDKTPVRTGNARSRTHLSSERISANYGYAGRLDDGWSKQAPKGMSDPTIDYFEKQIDIIVRKNG